MISLSKCLKINQSPVYLSLCVLPGLDPQSQNIKLCQDACIEIHNESSILMSLFDGHGEFGQDVVEFCCRQVKDLYTLLKDKHAVKSNLG